MAGYSESKLHCLCRGAARRHGSTHSQLPFKDRDRNNRKWRSRYCEEDIFRQLDCGRCDKSILSSRKSCSSICAIEGLNESLNILLIKSRSIACLRLFSKLLFKMPKGSISIFTSINSLSDHSMDSRSAWKINFTWKVWRPQWDILVWAPPLIFDGAYDWIPEDGLVRSKARRVPVVRNSLKVRWWKNCEI